MKLQGVNSRRANITKGAPGHNSGKLQPPQSLYDINLRAAAVSRQFIQTRRAAIYERQQSFGLRIQVLWRRPQRCAVIGLQALGIQHIPRIRHQAGALLNQSVTARTYPPENRN